MKYTIDVTAEDIEKGVPNRTDYCPIALAANRALNNESLRVWVEMDEIEIRSHNDEPPEEIALPLGARDFIECFDLKEPVEPFSFEIEIPEAA